MIQTVEAVIDESGTVHLTEAVRVSGTRRALVTILEEPARVSESASETALLSEAALADWNRPEEDEAWSHLQPAAS